MYPRIPQIPRPDQVIYFDQPIRPTTHLSLMGQQSKERHRIASLRGERILKERVWTIRPVGVHHSTSRSWRAF
jgi:hypothetical protein